MFFMHIAYGLDLMALTMGTALLIWSMKNPGKGSWLGKFFGAIVMVLSMLSMVCIYSCNMKAGDCHKPGEEMSMTAPVDGAAAAMKKGEHKK